jgi:hypothetical protein
MGWFGEQEKIAFAKPHTCVILNAINRECLEQAQLRRSTISGALSGMDDG